jgi:hypothetical protein
VSENPRFTTQYSVDVPPFLDTAVVNATGADPLAATATAYDAEYGPAALTQSVLVEERVTVPVR